MKSGFDGPGPSETEFVGPKYTRLVLLITQAIITVNTISVHVRNSEEKNTPGLGSTTAINTRSKTSGIEAEEKPKKNDEETTVNKKITETTPNTKGSAAQTAVNSAVNSSTAQNDAVKKPKFTPKKWKAEARYRRHERLSVRSLQNNFFTF